MPDTRDLYIKAHADDKEISALFNKLQAIGGISKATAKDLTTYEQAVKAGVISTREYNTALEAVARNEKRAADEVQRYGQMVARAEAADRQRTATINAQAAAQERLARTQSLAGLRGTAGIGQLAGVLPGGSSTAIYGVSSLLNAGLSTTTLLAGGAALAIGALGAATFKAANSLGEYARQQQNLSERTGLTTQETQLFSRAAGLVDVNAGTLTVTMRTLSKALSDNSEEGKKAKEALAELGIGGADQLLPMSELLPLIARRLAALNDGAEKDRIAITLLGRSGLELLPLFNNFDKLSAAVKQSGIVIDQDGIQKALAYELQIKELGLEWDATIIKFKQAAVALLTFEIKRGKGVDEFITNLATGGTGQGIIPRLLGLTGSQALPSTPGAVPNSTVDPSKLRAQQRDSDLLGIRQQFQTPKERIDEEIKRRREELTLAEGTFKTAAAGAPAQKAEADVRDRARRLQIAEQQRDALKGSGKNPALEETLRLQEQLIRAQEKELTGEAKIDAEYQKQLLHLKEKTGAKGQRLDTPENLALASQIRDANLAALQQQQRIAATDSQRSVDDATLRAGQERVRGTSSRRSQLALQALSQSGDEAGGIKAREGQEVADAKLEYEFARQEAAVKTAAAEKDHEARGDDLKYLAALTSIQQAEITARASLETKIANAKLQTEIALIALREKDRKDEENRARQVIETRRAESDIVASRNRTIAEGQTRLTVANAAPGFGLQAELNADARRLQRDRAQAALNQSRIAGDITGLQAQASADPKRKQEIELEIGKLRIEAAKEAGKIEDDIIKTRYDAEVRIAEERKSREQAFRSGATGLVQAALQGKSADYLRGIGQNILGTVTGNVAGLAFPTVDKIAGGVSKSVSGTAQDPTFVGKLLAGTPFGPRESNPIAATNANTTAVAGLTKSVDTLAQTITAVVTGQPLPTGATALSGLGGLAGGLGSLGIPGLGALGGAIGTFGSDTNGIVGQGSAVLRAITGTSSSGGGITGSGETSPATGFSGILKALGGSGGGSKALSTLFGGVGGNKGDTSSGEAGGTTLPQFLGSAAAAGAAAYGAATGIAQVTKGGARNTVSGVGKLATSALSLDADPTGISQAALGAVALGSLVVGAILGDPRVARQKQLTKELNEGVYQAPVAQNRTQDISGNYTDFDKFGKVQTSNLSAIPQVVSPYISLRNGSYYDVSGQVLSPFGGASSAPFAPASPANPIQPERAGFAAQPQAPTTVQIHFNSLDPSSALDYFKANPQIANSVIHFGLTQATGPAQGAVRSVVGLR